MDESSHTTNQKQSQETGKTVLKNIIGLRFFEGDEVDFWTRLLLNTSVLCKSPLALFLTKEHQAWVVRQEYYVHETIKTEHHALLVSAFHLGDRADQNGFAYESLDGVFPSIRFPSALVVKVNRGDPNEKAILLIVLDKENLQQFNDRVVRAQLISDIPLHYYTRKRKSQPETKNESISLLVNALEVSNKVMNQAGFQLSCMTLVNEIASRFSCSRVSIGWEKGDYIRTVVISHLEDFHQHSEGIFDLEHVFEEAHEQSEIVVHPKLNSNFVVNKTHQAYCQKHNLIQMVTLPMTIGDRVVSVVTCEKQDSALSCFEIDTVQLIVNQVAPWLNTLHDADRWIGYKMAIGIKKTLSRCLGVEHTLLKAASIMISVALFYIILGVWDYRVEGVAALHTDSVSYIWAPYEGRISDVKVHEGDEVHQGDTLLTLDTQELLLKEAQTSAEWGRYLREAEKNRAHEALADMEIMQSRVNEVKAELDKIRYYINQANRVALFDGIVVEGDRKKLLESPVSKGDILMKIAKIDAMYVKIRISERDIDYIIKGAKGQLILLSRPSDIFNITFDKLIPMAEVDPTEGNVFVIKAALDHPPPAWWRPGMSGIAKIDAGERKIIWILTHRLTEFLRIYFWW